MRSKMLFLPGSGGNADKKKGEDNLLWVMCGYLDGVAGRVP